MNRIGRPQVSKRIIDSFGSFSSRHAPGFQSIRELGPCALLLLALPLSACHLKHCKRCVRFPCGTNNGDNVVMAPGEQNC